LTFISPARHELQRVVMSKSSVFDGLFLLSAADFLRGNR
jgi:hypothetical protein